MTVTTNASPNSNPNPNPGSLPEFYDSLDSSLEEVWQLMGLGTTDRRSAFHTPVIASIDLQGHPSARTMILRGADRHNRTLGFHADIRSSKIAQWRIKPGACIIAYDVGKKIQLRINGEVTLHAHDEIANTAWQNSRAMSRLTYCVDDAPGSVIATPTTLPAPKLDIVNDLADEELDQLPEMGRENFCVVTVHVTSIEWVYLASQGNRRALFSWPEGKLQSVWLQP